MGMKPLRLVPRKCVTKRKRAGPMSLPASITQHSAEMRTLELISRPAGYIPDAGFIVMELT
jgi:hypothetical protein